ncbi:DUF4097 family beta strand repeat-containing protein [Pseudothermotoga thermarum]|uniref:Uncharacterized protein n=1 Tax=Pseudothermotoga thermarum DSM 5069 TaxID=688269 RepID=F7YXU3_9THEM|nr:DUF4097 family beta strand repeat-containing protein [Pseudothermotoga thermarum]AEH50740.1 hypothetical protein Theth_0653 [Pseudothermotoga thermarum DSM 5069]
MQKFSLDFSDVRKLIVKSLSSDVQISSSQMEYSVTGPEKDLLIEKKNGTLEISVTGRGMIPIFNHDSTPISLTIPTQLDEIIVTTISGDVKANHVKAENMKFKTTSGEISLNRLLANFCEIKTVSGDISISQQSSRKIVITTVSGDIKIKEVVCEDYEWIISSISGDVEIETVGVPSLRILFKTVGGDLTSNIGYVREGKEYVFGDGRMRLIVNTTSGDLTIKSTNRAERAESIEKKILKLVAEGKLSYEQAKEILKELV